MEAYRARVRVARRATVSDAFDMSASTGSGSGAGTGKIDVHVTGGGTISNGELRVDTKAVAQCSLCSKKVEASVSIGDAAACAVCLRDRLDALSVARFRLRESSSGSLPWGKVTG
jgi:hypothetical protein